jgi:hypothetical protein
MSKLWRINHFKKVVTYDEPTQTNFDWQCSLQIASSIFYSNPFSSLGDETTHIHTYIYIKILHTYIQVYTYLHNTYIFRIHTYIHTYIHTHIYSCIYYIHTYIHYIYTYIHAYITYIHTLHTYIYSCIYYINTYIHTDSSEAHGSITSIYAHSVKDE